MEEACGAILRGGCEHHLKDGSWTAKAVWLVPHPTKTCFPAPMRYGEKTCAIRALSMYCGAAMDWEKVRPTLRADQPSVDEMYDIAMRHGEHLRLIWHDDAQCDRYLLFGSMPGKAGGKQGDKGCFIPVKARGAVKWADRKRDIERALVKYKPERLLVTLRNPTLYPEDHCVVLTKEGGKWTLSDPLLRQNSRLKLPYGNEWLLSFLLGARVILGA